MKFSDKEIELKRELDRNRNIQFNAMIYHMFPPSKNVLEEVLFGTVSQDAFYCIRDKMHEQA